MVKKGKSLLFQGEAKVVLRRFFGDSWEVIGRVMVKRSALVTSSLGNRRFGDFVFLLTGRVVSVVAPFYGRWLGEATCPHCNGLGETVVWGECSSCCGVGCSACSGSREELVFIACTCVINSRMGRKK